MVTAVESTPWCAEYFHTCVFTLPTTQSPKRRGLRGHGRVLLHVLPLLMAVESYFKGISSFTLSF